MSRSPYDKTPLARAISDGQGVHGRVRIVARHPNGEVFDVREFDNVVTTVGKTALRDAMIGTLGAFGTLKYHALGTGIAGDASATALTTECTTQYQPSNTRAAGSQTNNGAATYRTVATTTFAQPATLKEWGLMSQQGAPGGTMWATVSISPDLVVAQNDTLQTTYDCTFA